MAIEIFSRPSLHERMSQMWVSNLGPVLLVLKAEIIQMIQGFYSYSQFHSASVLFSNSLIIQCAMSHDRISQSKFLLKILKPTSTPAVMRFCLPLFWKRNNQVCSLHKSHSKYKIWHCFVYFSCLENQN